MSIEAQQKKDIGNRTYTHSFNFCYICHFLKHAYFHFLSVQPKQVMTSLFGFLDILSEH